MKKILLSINSVLYNIVFTNAIDKIEPRIEVLQLPHEEVLAYAACCDVYFAVLDADYFCEDDFRVYDALMRTAPDLPVALLFDQGAHAERQIERARNRGIKHCIKKPLNESFTRNTTMITRALREMIDEIRACRPPAEQSTLTLPADSGYEALFIAASTGGPNILETILCGLPAHFPAPILVAQHMPKNFTRGLAQNLNSKCAMAVKEAEDGETIQKGTIYIAPGGLNMYLTKRRQVLVNDDEFVNDVYPCADLLFASGADAFAGGKVMAVVLTGMGKDGTAGVRALKQKCTCYCIAQSEKTCTVYGMPRVVVENNLSDVILDAQDIAAEIIKEVLQEV